MGKFKGPAPMSTMRIAVKRLELAVSRALPVQAELLACYPQIDPSRLALRRWTEKALARRAVKP